MPPNFCKRVALKSYLDVPITAVSMHICQHMQPIHLSIDTQSANTNLARVAAAPRAGYFVNLTVLTTHRPNYSF
jgi:hypothetical protein